MKISGRSFEEEVRHVARLIWPGNQFAGAEIVNGRERDGIFETEDVIHVVECTTLRTKQKAETNIKKTAELVQRLRKRHPDKSAKGWFITQFDPTADQQSIAKRYSGTVNALSFESFKSRLVDARQYLSCRTEYAFGSIRDPIDDSIRVAADEYVELGPTNLGSGDLVSFQNIYGALHKL